MIVTPPGLLALFGCFARISLLSVGGGLTAWIRRTVVEQKRWMDEAHFLSGYALSQIAPGPNAINLAVFVGTTLRGRGGAISSLLGLIVPPFFVVLLLGSLYESRPVAPAVETVLAGAGASAIGLMIATGLRMGRSGLKHAPELLVALVVAAALVAGAPLIWVAFAGAALALALVSWP